MKERGKCQKHSVRERERVGLQHTGCTEYSAVGTNTASYIFFNSYGAYLLIRFKYHKR